MQIIWKRLLICFDFSYRLSGLMDEQFKNICRYSFVNDFWISVNMLGTMGLTTLTTNNNINLTWNMP